MKSNSETQDSRIKAAEKIFEKIGEGILDMPDGELVTLMIDEGAEFPKEEMPDVIGLSEEFFGDKFVPPKTGLAYGVSSKGGIYDRIKKSVEASRPEDVIDEIHQCLPEKVAAAISPYVQEFSVKSYRRIPGVPEKLVDTAAISIKLGGKYLLGEMEFESGTITIYGPAERHFSSESERESWMAKKEHSISRRAREGKDCSKYESGCDRIAVIGPNGEMKVLNEKYAKVLKPLDKALKPAREYLSKE